ncbi:hypothetical protein [Sandaracinus amylolyticus]|uniref:hypothetical protein n=1 Tax=Sandaracinus amylolyticus TaxID=927083 RepID=UPI0012ED2FB9|nr:hypothetical protein [Sandaracinus amylolyticus]
MIVVLGGRRWVQALSRTISGVARSAPATRLRVTNWRALAIGLAVMSIGCGIAADPTVGGQARRRCVALPRCDHASRFDGYWGSVVQGSRYGDLFLVRGCMVVARYAYDAFQYPRGECFEDGNPGDAFALHARITPDSIEFGGCRGALMYRASSSDELVREEASGAVTRYRRIPEDDISSRDRADFECVGGSSIGVPEWFDDAEPRDRLESSSANTER